MRLSLLAYPDFFSSLPACLYELYILISCLGGKKYGAVNGHDVDMKDEDDECVDELAEAGAESKLVALLEEERHIPWDRVPSNAADAD